MTYRKAREILYGAVNAARTASDEDKDRALNAMTSLGNAADPDRAFVYDAFLGLLGRGVRPTEKNILEEATAMYRANEAFFAGHQKHAVARAAA